MRLAAAAGEGEAAAAAVGAPARPASARRHPSSHIPGAFATSVKPSAAALVLQQHSAAEEAGAGSAGGQLSPYLMSRLVSIQQKLAAALADQEVELDCASP